MVMVGSGSVSLDEPQINTDEHRSGSVFRPAEAGPFGHAWTSRSHQEEPGWDVRDGSSWWDRLVSHPRVARVSAGRSVFIRGQVDPLPDGCST